MSEALRELAAHIELKRPAEVLATDIAFGELNVTATLAGSIESTIESVVAQLLGLPEGDCPIRKGSVWWLRQRERGGRLQTVIVTVQTPELL